MAHSEHNAHRGLPQVRGDNYQQWANRKTPQWFKDAKLGIFIHWGPYSVPAFAETSGALGHIDPQIVHKHNPYSEWYYNTIRFPDSEAAKFHKENYGDAPYDDLLDMWKAKDFDADALVKVFKRAGARFLVPVTKHHDGIALWDAPETGTRNTVHRGPKRDIIGEWAKASEDNDIKFGVYYSTGIDWDFYPTQKPWSWGNWERPGLGAKEYNEYAWKHCADLIERHKPYLLWGDIDWPKAGVAPGPHSVEALFNKLYDTNPEALVNDRYGSTHWDFKTVEYGLGSVPDPPQMWQCARGIGYSFAYNKLETESQYMSGQQAVQLLVDVCSRGGNLLLNVGPDEHGNIPELQMRCLDYLGDYMSMNAEAINDTIVVDDKLAKPIGGQQVQDAWVRWLQRDKSIFAFVDGTGAVNLDVDGDRIDLKSAKLFGGAQINLSDGAVDLAKFSSELRPLCIEFTTF